MENHLQEIMPTITSIPIENLQIIQQTVILWL